MPTVQIHHIALSVRDIEASARWYERVFDLELFAEIDEPAPVKVYRTPEGQAIDLRQDPDVVREPFTQTRVGLDHVGLGCADRAELEKWRSRLDEFGVANSGIVESPFGLHLNFRDPDDIAFELYVPAA